MIKFDCTVKAVKVAEKKVKRQDEDGNSYEGTMRLGTLTLEFNAAKVDVNTLSKFIAGVPVAIGVANTQYEMDGLFDNE